MKEEPYDNDTIEEANVGDVWFLQTGISNRQPVDELVRKLRDGIRVHYKPHG